MSIALPASDHANTAHPPTCVPDGFSSPVTSAQSSASDQALFRVAMRIGLALTEGSGNLSDAASQLNEQTMGILSVIGETHRLSTSNRQLADKLSELRNGASGSGQRLSDATMLIANRISAARSNIEALARSSNEMDVQVMAAASQVTDLRKASSGIQNIAREIQLLAVNAGVEAARHGVSGRGFAVIAEAVKKLADQTRAATDQTEKHLAKLSTTMDSLQGQGSRNLEFARNADADTSAITTATGQLVTSRDGMLAIIQQIDGHLPRMNANGEACDRVLAVVQAAAAHLRAIDEDITGASDKFQRLTQMSEEMTGVLLQSAGDLPISSLAALCAATARRISDVFAAAVAGGSISIEQLFDQRYRPIEGSNPRQFLTNFTSFTDGVLPDIQEQVLASDPRIAFCAAADRSGYLPTHNRAFSHPQGQDPVWNAQHSRNRRIFDDRTSLTSVRNEKPVLLQTYRRDMGGGSFAVMNELASPIVVGGRHWGGFRLGFRL